MAVGSTPIRLERPTLATTASWVFKDLNAITYAPLIILYIKKEEPSFIIKRERRLHGEPQGMLQIITCVCQGDERNSIKGPDFTDAGSYTPLQASVLKQMKVGKQSHKPVQQIDFINWYYLYIDDMFIFKYHN